MNRAYKILIFNILWFFSSFNIAFSQQSINASLQNILQESDNLLDKGDVENAIQILTKVDIKPFSNSHKIALYHQLQTAYTHPEIMKLDSSIVYLNKEISLIEDDSLLYNRYMELGNSHGRLSQFPKAELAYLAALTRIAFANTTADSIRTYKYVGLSLAKQAKYVEGSNYIEKANAIGANSNNVQSKFEGLYSKIHYHSLTRKWAERLDLLPDLLNLAIATEDSSKIHTCYVLLSQSFEIFEKYDSAEYYIIKAIDFNTNPSPLSYYDLLISRASIQENLGNIAAAESNALTAIKGFKKYNWDKTEAANFAFELMGDIQLDKGDYPQAIEYYSKAAENAKNGGSLARQMDYTGKIIGAYEQQPEFKELATLSLYHANLLDSFAKDFYKVELLEVETRMGLTLKEKELAAKNTQIAYQHSQQKLFLLLISLLALSALGALYAWWRLRKNKNLINQQKIKLEDSLQEKEVLLKEIHHRVKNNLQIISSLLDKQARRSPSQITKRMMQEGKDRIQSMALIHQNLYQNEQFTTIDTKTYFNELIQNISMSYQKDTAIKVNATVDAVNLDIDTAIPLGLIVNELMTNAFKHAFKQKKEGQIKIDFTEEFQNKYRLKIEDNGNGFDSPVDLNSPKTLGISLVQGLVEQLDGTFNYSSDNQHTIFSIHF